MRNRTAGFFLPASVIATLVLTLSVISLCYLFRSAWKQTVYLESMDKTYRLAEKGLYAAMSQLTQHSDLTSFDTSAVTDPELKGTYESKAYLRHSPVDPIYYVITTARRTVNGQEYSTRLHAYVRLSNTSEYFAAVPGALTISHPVDIGQGKVYASSLTFIVDGLGPERTYLKKAEYYDACFVQNLSGGGGTTVWAAGDKTEVIISTPASGEPTKMPARLVFPQVLPADIEHYRALAGPHTQTNIFKGELYPPGYSSYTNPNQPNDFYTTPGHTTMNEHHVYFFDGDIKIEGNIHGQILFVANGDIHISSNLVVSTDLSLIDGSNEWASKANQAVLIARGNVYIDNSMNVDVNLGTVQTIQAMIIAPNGTLVPKSYGNEAIHNALSLKLEGSLIMGTLNSSPRLPEVFRGGRTYGYLDSLRTNPPPYLPSVSEIYGYLEQTGTNE